MREHTSSAMLGLLGLAAFASVTACSDNPAPTSSDGRLTVAAAFYPVEEVVRRVGGDRIDVISLVPPGEEAHEYEPTAKQLADLDSADLVFYLGDEFQPGVERAIAGLDDDVVTIDLLDGLTMRPVGQEIGEEIGEEEADEDEHGGDDPHVWLDPANMALMAATAQKAMAAADPDGSTEFAANATAYGHELAVLDDAFTSGLADCTSDVVVTGHHAFGYLAGAFGLTQVAIAGISPSEEPSARTLTEVAEFAAANDVTTIFFEENLPDDLSATVADEIGASTAVLDPVESLSSEQMAAGATYISVMQENLNTLRAGLGCQ